MLSAAQKKIKISTLCIIHDQSRILLGMKKRGFGKGRWNGFGGKVETGETIPDAARREVIEESGVKVKELEKMGIVNFEFQGDPKVLEVHIFRADQMEGEPIESEEMKPQWFAIEKIPYERMWSDDIHWLPMLLAGKKFKGSFLFDRPSDEDHSAVIMRMDIKEIEQLQ